jgi:hypothetical protein
VALATDGEDLFLADAAGEIHHYDHILGTITPRFSAGNDVRSLRVFEGDLLAGGGNGTIRRLDKQSGALVGVYSPGVPVDAMVEAGTAFYVASSQGVVLRADLAHSQFQTVATVPSAIHSMAADTTHLYLAAPTGQVWRIERATGTIAGGFLVPSDAVGLEAQGGDLLVAGSNAWVLRVHAETGVLAASLQAPGPVTATVLCETPEPGVAYCYGAACPCGNDDAEGGCTNSTGRGARLRATGSASLAADDLVMTAIRLPAGKPALFVAATGSTWQWFHDGILCAGLTGLRRYPPGSTGPGGIFALGPGTAAASQQLPPKKQLTPGSTWSFQVWYRDAQGPCGTGANVSNAYTLTFLP